VRKFDVIHVFSASYLSFILAPSPAILVSKLYRKKVVLNYRSGEAADHLLRWGRSTSRVIRLVDHIVVPSRFLVDVFARFGYEADFIYNIADADRFRYRERTDAKVILVPRMLEPLYDPETAIRAFVKVRQQIPGAKLILAGSGSLGSRLRSIVEREQIPAVEFTGQVDRTDMPALYDRADLFLNTSLIDNMPVAIIEAFYCGLPVVTTNAGGIPYLVEHQSNGLVVPVKDVDAVAGALLRVIEDSALRKGLIAGGVNSAREFNWQTVRGQWGDLYAGMANADG
jgi:glycosyltransferase involved in cell wall biosynthesis